MTGCRLNALQKVCEVGRQTTFLKHTLDGMRCCLPRATPKRFRKSYRFIKGTFRTQGTEVYFEIKVPLEHFKLMESMTL